MSNRRVKELRRFELRHRSRIVAVEARRLERELRAVGPMPRERLKRSCGTGRWRNGTFEEAIVAGVQSGRLRELPLGWIEAAPLGQT